MHGYELRNISPIVNASQVYPSIYVQQGFKVFTSRALLIHAR